MGKPNDKKPKPTVSSVRQKLQQGRSLNAAESQLAVSNPELAALVAALRRRPK
jgi:hypothetical protein